MLVGTHDQKVSLDGGLRVDNDSLALLGHFDGRSLDRVLVTQQRCKTRLDEPSSKGEDDEEDDKEGESGIGRDDGRNGGDDEQEVRNH